MEKNFSITLKRLGKKKVYRQEYNFQNEIKTLKDLIEVCVEQEVEKYNEKVDNTSILQFLSPTDISKQAESGKIGFGEQYNTNKADLEKSIENALLAFKDGLYVVFINDVEVTDMQEKIDLNGGEEIVFIRLTFLTGTYW
ncbi:MAG: hypothetical protein ACPGSD_04475 [Flavobacteriales bacterium]